MAAWKLMDVIEGRSICGFLTIIIQQSTSNKSVCMEKRVICGKLNANAPHDLEVDNTNMYN